MRTLIFAFAVLVFSPQVHAAKWSNWINIEEVTVVPQGLVLKPEGSASGCRSGVFRLYKGKKGVTTAMIAQVLELSGQTATKEVALLSLLLAGQDVEPRPTVRLYYAVSNRTCYVKRVKFRSPVEGDPTYSW